MAAKRRYMVVSTHVIAPVLYGGCLGCGTRPAVLVYLRRYGAKQRVWHRTARISFAKPAEIKHMADLAGVVYPRTTGRSDVEAFARSLVGCTVAL